MPNVLFDIPNPLSNTIILDTTRKGRVQFTVNNVSGRPLTRVVARLTALPDPTDIHAKWLRLDPEGFREFKIADSLQYTVQITVPESGLAGNYAFRLDVWDDTNPDDTLVKGPSMTFTVPDAPPPPPKQPFPWWIPVVAVAVIVLVVGAVLILKPGPAPAPTSTPTQTPTATGTPTLTSTPIPIHTPTPTPTPMPGNFVGHWNLAGTGQGNGASTELKQNGINVMGTFFNGTDTGTISGFVTGNTFVGQWQSGPNTGTISWTLTSNNLQFQGSFYYDNTYEMCGWRNGSSRPVPCSNVTVPASTDPPP
jgi:hypothetical protein